MDKKIDDLIKALDQGFQKGVGHISVKTNKDDDIVINTTNQSCGENSPCGLENILEDQDER